MINFLKTNLFKYILIGVLLIIILFSFKKCSDYKIEIDNLHYSNEQLVSKEKIFKSYINNQGQLINEQKIIILNKNEDLVKTIEKENNLKELIFQLKNKTTTSIKPTPTKLTDKLTNIIYVKDSIKCLPLPISYKRGDNKWWKEVGRITEKGYLETDTLEFYNESEITVGYKKRKLKDIFKKREFVVTQKDKNPYTVTNSMDNIYIKDKSNRLSLGISIGYGLTPSIGLTPYIGIGIGYQIIKF